MKNTLLLISTFLSFSMFSQEKLQSAIYHEYDNSSWNKAYGINYEYDKSNNLINKSAYKWNGSSYIESSKTSYTYNSDNKIIEEVIMTWNDSLEKFENIVRQTSTYAPSGLLNEFIIYSPNGSAWDMSEKQVISYTDSQISSIEYSSYDGEKWNIEKSIKKRS